MLEGEPPDKGEYEKLSVDRDALVCNLRRLTDYAEQIVDTNGDFFILHLGV